MGVHTQGARVCLPMIFHACMHARQLIIVQVGEAHAAKTGTTG